ncbi:CYP-42 P450 monooxygenase [Mollisia scopiformis]|uniref:CYP-42 P450 monooxygenase n=1 Tax=Mollisia scopiformis TaxID=149040 RepID=A0A194X4S5_MOLSC|nr:CYP-42 P450 monooxygenase [Mollisia scopiformis]KUJ15176.1 CYP-42 P450 monooxygenase [Mollisia scopiformis]
MCYLISFFFQRSSNLPSINYDKSQWTYFPAKSKFRTHAKKLIAQGFQKFSGPFNLITDLGPLVMLPPEYIDAVNQERKLDFTQYTAQDLLSKYDTFKSFRGTAPGLIEEAVMKGLTRSLPKFTKVLSEEMTRCLSESWVESTEWHEVDLREDVLNWVARLSSRIFNGDPLTTNSEWIRISKEFTVNIFTAVAICKMIPYPLRWFAERTLPVCRRVRADRRAGAKMLAPIIAERKAEIAAAQREGRAPVLPDDSIEWLRNAAKSRKYDDVLLQLGLSMAAIHTTSDLLGQALLNLGAHPEMIEPLRTEAVEVLRAHGWSKVALTELRIMDSFFKETQRLKPINMASMHRLATADVELPNGVKIRKGEKIAISSHRMWSEADYEDPETFDGYRFVKRRKVPGLEHKSHLISTSHEHTAFSHGKHACPGRFFAANEVKIAMVHLLLKYDMRLEEPKDAGWLEYGTNMFTNPKARMSVRRRKEEIDLDGMR